MNQLDKLQSNIANTLADNDDVRQLFATVESTHKSYQEIQFQQNVDAISNRWPLLRESRQLSHSRQNAVTEPQHTDKKLA